MYLMCRWARVSRSGYYRWRNQGLSETQKRREELTILITHFFHESEQTYRCVDVSTQLWLNQGLGKVFHSSCWLGDLSGLGDELEWSQRVSRVVSEGCGDADSSGQAMEADRGVA